MRIVVAVAQVQIELARGISELQELIERVRGLRYLIPGPSKIGKIALGDQAETGMGLPGQAQIETALILNLTPIAEALGIERSIAIGIESLDGHQREGLA